MSIHLTLRKQSAELNTKALKNLLDAINPKLKKWMANDIPLILSFNSPVIGVNVDIERLPKKDNGGYWLWQVSVDQNDFEKLIDPISRAKHENSLIPFITQAGSSSKSNGEHILCEIFKKEGVIFFNNPYGFFPNILEMKAPDFLVFYKGECRILEVDGSQHNESRESDYERDRTFDKFGIRVSRFTHKQCVTDPVGVIQEFMNLFKDYVSKTPNQPDQVIDVDFKKVRNNKS